MTVINFEQLSEFLKDGTVVLVDVRYNNKTCMSLILTDKTLEADISNKILQRNLNFAIF